MTTRSSNPCLRMSLFDLTEQFQPLITLCLYEAPGLACSWPKQLPIQLLCYAPRPPQLCSLSHTGLMYRRTGGCSKLCPDSIRIREIHCNGLSRENITQKCVTSQCEYIACMYCHLTLFQVLYQKVINQNNYPDSKTRCHIQDRGQDMYYWAICAVTKLGSVTLRLSRTSTHMPEKM